MKRLAAALAARQQWNEQISEMQTGLEFEPLIEFLERLKEPIWNPQEQTQ